MSNKVSEFGTFTYENLKKAHEKLCREDKQKVYHPPIVFLSNGDFKILDYLATKYPKGAKQISKIDKKVFKKQSLKNKRYYIKQEIPSVEKVIVYEQEALRFSGMNYLATKYQKGAKQIKKIDKKVLALGKSVFTYTDLKATDEIERLKDELIN